LTPLEFEHLVFFGGGGGLVVVVALQTTNSVETRVEILQWTLKV